MLNKIRKIQKGLLIGVTIIIIIAFSFYSGLDVPTKNDRCLIKSNNKCYSRNQVNKLLSYRRAGLDLGLREFLFILEFSGQKGNDPYNFVKNLITIRDKGRALGIIPGDKEIKNSILNLPIMSQKWANYEYIKNNILGKNGLIESDLYNLVKDYLTFNKLNNFIKQGNILNSKEIEKLYQKENQKYDLHVITFLRSKVLSSVSVNDQDIKKYYDSNKDNLKTKPKREFKYIKFIPFNQKSDLKKENQLKKRLEYSKLVNNIYSKLDSTNFDKIALNYKNNKLFKNIEVKKTDLFSKNNYPKEFKNQSDITSILFKESLKVGEITVPILNSNNEYYIFLYNKKEESRSFLLEEASNQISKKIVLQKSNDKIKKTANDARLKIIEKLNKGEKFTKIIETIDAKKDFLKLFSLSSDNNNSGIDAISISNSLENLKKGDLSNPYSLPDDKGFIITYLDNVYIYKDDKKNSSLSIISSKTKDDIGRKLFISWLEKSRKEN